MLQLRFRFTFVLLILFLCGLFAWAMRHILLLPHAEQPLLGIDGAIGLIFMLVSLGVGLLGLRHLRPQNSMFQWAFASLAVLVLTHVSCSLIVWHTLGEVAAVGSWMIGGVILIPACLCAGGACRISLIASLTIAAVLLPTLWVPQSLLALRLEKLQREVAHIGLHLERVKQETGDYPRNLDDYRFRDPRFRSLVSYEPNPVTDKNGYIVRFELFDGDSTYREFSPRRGWWYYPD